MLYKDMVAGKLDTTGTWEIHILRQLRTLILSHDQWLIVNSIRHTGASSDAISLDSSGNVTCNGTATGLVAANFFKL